MLRFQRPTIQPLLGHTFPGDDPAPGGPRLILAQQLLQPIFRLLLLLGNCLQLFTGGVVLLDKVNGGSDTWPQQLIYLNRYGNLLMRKILKRLIQPGDYFTLKQASDIITFHLPERKAKKLIEFLKEINRPSKVDVSTIKQRKNGKKRLRQLTDLNINPVTIDVRASCLFLPSLFPDLYIHEIES